MQFAVEAMRPDGSTVAEAIEAPDRSAAVDTLREKGLLVLRLAEADDAPSASLTSSLRLGRSGMAPRDLVLFTRQMKMLLEAGAPLVPALEAAEQQCARPAVRDLLRQIREQVEEGDSLSTALEAQSHAFDPVFRSMVAAGEATASLPQVFARLGQLALQQQQTRKLLVGALIYPCVLSVLMTGAISVLLLFVVPRFRGLFANFRRPLPVTTQFLFKLSDGLLHGWPYVVGGAVAAGAVVVLMLRWSAVRRRVDDVLLQLPMIGPLLARMTFARVVRIWAAMLRSHVPLLETVRQSREAVTNVSFLKLLAGVEESLAGGGRMGQALTTARLADPIVVSAIRTGEENGRLAEATEFVSDWMDEDNARVVQQATRLAEPLLLAVMGVVVGFVASALFIPLFDMATAAG